jgi:hypothetical protein
MESGERALEEGGASKQILLFPSRATAQSLALPVKRRRTASNGAES